MRGKMMSDTGILQFTTMLALAVIALASAGHAQNATSQPEAGARIDGWYGEMEWSFHQKEDTGTAPDHSQSGMKFDGEATLRIHDDGQGRLLGLLEGSQKIDTHWWTYALPGSGIFNQLCRGSAPPTAVRARVEGYHPSGSQPLSLQLTEVVAKITPILSGGGSNASCNAALFAQLTIDNGPTISGVVRSLKPVGDGTYKAGFDQSDGTFDVHWSLILRPSVIVPRG
ncbi:MAG: hypothetical protein M9939_22355 [Mesorhizobium sp.]|nr:hypothetical protein [Mesorhizobium sp.]MCO5163875.1 hypothetical protein [Mesorhizobium sp.]